MSGPWTRDLFTSRESKEVEIQAQPLTCLVSHHNRFYSTKVILNQGVWSLLKDAFIFGRWGTAYLCERCGFKQEFYK